MGRGIDSSISDPPVRRSGAGDGSSHPPGRQEVLSLTSSFSESLTREGREGNSTAIEVDFSQVKSAGRQAAKEKALRITSFLADKLTGTIRQKIQEIKEDPKKIVPIIGPTIAQQALIVGPLLLGGVSPAIALGIVAAKLGIRAYSLFKTGKMIQGAIRSLYGYLADQRARKEAFLASCQAIINRMSRDKDYHRTTAQKGQYLDAALTIK